MHITAGIGALGRHVRIKIKISKTGKERVTMLRRHSQHGLDRCMRKIAAARLADAGLGNVEANVHYFFNDAW
jgi:hypothetical protein